MTADAILAAMRCVVESGVVQRVLVEIHRCDAPGHGHVLGALDHVAVAAGSAFQYIGQGLPDAGVGPGNPWPC